MIYTKQAAIGWEHFVRGRISISWGNIVNKQLSGTTDNFNTEAWGSKLVSINFKYILLLWEHRCKEEHGKNAEEIEYNLKRKLLEEIYHIRDKFRSNHFKDNNFINCNLHKLQEQDSGQLQGWLAGARILFNKFKKSIKKVTIFPTDENSIQELENDPG
jgi:hypothetical protein